MADFEATVQAVAAGTLHGLIRVAGLLTATPIGAIREVVPRPPRLEPFPSHRPEVCGAIDLRGQRIPVIDLAEVLGLSEEDSAEINPVVAILRHEGRVFGALVQSTAGVIALNEDALTPIDFVTSDNMAGVDLAGAPVTAGFIVGARSGVVLDCGRIASLAGLPLVRERMATAAQHMSKTLPTLVFRVGNLRAAIPASCVDATVPWQTITPPPAETPLWIGMLRYNGAEIPVVDTLRVLDHGQLPHGRSSGAAIVIRTVRQSAAADGLPETAASAERQGLVALLIDGIDDIVRLTGADVHPISHNGLPGSALSKGLAMCGGSPCLLLDDVRLAADPRLVQLGQIEQRALHEGPGAAASKTAGTLSATASAQSLANVRPYLVLRMGQSRFSVPLEQVEEILPAGQDMIVMPDLADGLRGLFSHRGQAVPLVDLATCLGLFPSFADEADESAGDGAMTGCGGFVVIGRETTPSGPRRTAFCVDALCSVDRVAPQVLGNPTHVGARDTRVPYSTIRLADGHACSVLDLTQLSGRFTRETDAEKFGTAF